MKIVLLIVVLLIIVSVFLLAKYGLFAKAQISEREVGPLLLVYVQHYGDYSKVGVKMDELYYDLRDNFSIETTKGFGIYYDNPQKVSKDKLRSVVGCIVEGKTIDELEKVSRKYGVNEYPLSKSIVAEFPYKGKMSVIIGVLKVYPKLNEYIQAKQLRETPIMELYDQPNQRIEYISSPYLDEKVLLSFLEPVSNKEKQHE